MAVHLLTQVLRTWLSGHPLIPDLSEATIRTAQAHRLAGTLYHIDAPVGQNLGLTQQAWANNLALSLLRMDTLRRIWPSTAPEPLVIKGADIGENLFQDPGARQAVDLDLLVPASQFPQLCTHLCGIADRVEYPRFERFRQDPHYAVGLHFGPVLIEVHGALQPFHRGGPSAAMLWSRSRHTQWEGMSVRYPQNLDRLLIWLVNQAKGGFYNDLADILDLALILRSLPNVSWKSLRNTVTAVGLGRAWQVALAQLQCSGLWSSPPHTITGQLISRRVASVLTPRSEPPRIRFQGVKMWCCPKPLAVGVRLIASRIRHY